MRYPSILARIHQRTRDLGETGEDDYSLVKRGKRKTNKKNIEQRLSRALGEKIKFFFVFLFLWNVATHGNAGWHRKSCTKWLQDVVFSINFKLTLEFLKSSFLIIKLFFKGYFSSFSLFFFLFSKATVLYKVKTASFR